MAALDGVRILDLTRLLPGAYCTQLLADLGADVVKVEDTGAGDYLRWMPPQDDRGAPMFLSLNRNKRSLSIDLKHAEGVAAFLKVVANSDVVVEGFRPGVLERLGAGYDALAATNPRIILCSITGYGQNGPYRDRAGHDINYAALSGVLGMARDADGRPVVPAVQAGDLGGGALHAAVAVLAALIERERTGRGQWCDIAMADGLVAWMAPMLAMQRATGSAVTARSTVLHGRHPCYRVYRCKDGYMSLGALEPKFWKAFVAAIGVPELKASQFADGAEAERVSSEIESALMNRTRREWQQAFNGADVCCEPVLDVGEVLQHEQASARQLDAGDGIATPIRCAPEQAQQRRPAPGFGEHTREVLAEAGIAVTDIDVLYAQGVVR